MIRKAIGFALLFAAGAALAQQPIRTGIDATLSKSLRKFRSDAFTTKAVASALHQTQLVRERHDRITGSRA